VAVEFPEVTLLSSDVQEFAAVQPETVTVVEVGLPKTVSTNEADWPPKVVFGTAKDAPDNVMVCVVR
jgi:hypothetical protein